MYNPNIIITSKEEKLELPQPPVFTQLDDMFFYDKKGTGDWNEPAAAGTAIPQPEPIAPKLCPFRKKTYAMASNSEHNFNTYLNKAEYFEEEFLPCIREKCAVWNEKGQVCCY